MKGILSEHPEQAPMFIKNSFQTTALTWILSLGKKLKLFEFEEKPHCVLGKNHPDGRERMGVDGKATTLLLGIPVGLLLGEAKAAAVANRAPIPLGG